MKATLLAELRALAPAGCRVGMRHLDPYDVELLCAEEAADLPTAGAARLREFATGRALLHDLLPAAGPIRVSPSGAPALPAAWVGSLAHDRVAALAAVAAAEEFATLGVDLEHLGPTSDDDELRAAVLRADDTPLHATAAFVIKEAAYKAHSALGGAMVGPLAVRIEASGSTFRAHFGADTGGAVPHIDGVHLGDGDCWVALAAVRR